MEKRVATGPEHTLLRHSTATTTMSGHRSLTGATDGGDSFGMMKLAHVVQRLEALGAVDSAQTQALDSVISRIERALDKMLGPDPNPPKPAVVKDDVPVPAPSVSSLTFCCPPPTL